MDFYIANYGQERELNINEDEKILALKIIELLGGSNDLEIVRKSDSYATIISRANDVRDYDLDLVRFKYTEKTKWVSVALTNKDSEEQIDNPLFSAQKNKNQLMWKAKLNNIDEVNKLKDFIINYYNEYK